MKRAVIVVLWLLIGGSGATTTLTIRTWLDAPSDVGFPPLVLIYLVGGFPSVVLRLSIGGAQHLTPGLRSAETAMIVTWCLALAGLFLALVLRAGRPTDPST